MNALASIQAYYPLFQVGGSPAAVECTLSVVEANGRKYVKTPFAMIDAHADDDHKRQIGRGYYATEAEALAYLGREYPWAEQARLIMDKLAASINHSGVVTGPGRLADKLGVSLDAVYRLARGHRSFTPKQVRAALKAL